jgi:hypothetical protein
MLRGQFLAGGDSLLTHLLCFCRATRGDYFFQRVDMALQSIDFQRRLFTLRLQQITADLVRQEFLLELVDFCRQA